MVDEASNVEAVFDVRDLGGQGVTDRLRDDLVEQCVIGARDRTTMVDRARSPASCTMARKNLRLPQQRVGPDWVSQDRS